MTARPWSLPELRAGGVVYLLKLEWAGHVWRFASDSVDIVGNDGTVYHYAAAGIRASWTEAAELFTQQATVSAASFSDLFFDANVAQLVAQGHWLERSRATLSQWVPGRTVEQARVLLRGRVAEPRYGGAGEPVSFSVRPDILEDRAMYPDPDARVSDETWASAAESGKGAPYPHVYGTPGLGEPSVVATGVVPALLVSLAARVLLVAGHRVRATSVVVASERLERTKSFSITTGEDSLGRVVSYVVLDSTSSGTNIDAEDGDTYTTDWSGTAGGMANLEGTAKLDGAGEVIEHLMRLSQVEHSPGAWAALRGWLSPYRLSFYLDEPQAPSRIVRDAILPLLPVTVREGPGGLEPIAWRVDAGVADAVMRLVDGANVEFDPDGVEHLDPPLSNDLRIDYAPKAGGEPHRTMSRTGDESRAAHPMRPLIGSFLRWGALYADPIRTRVIYADATAGLVLRWRAHAFAYPWRAYTVHAVAADVGTLQPGMVVALTSAGLGLSDQVAHVTHVDWSGDHTALQVVAISIPARDQIPV